MLYVRFLSSRLATVYHHLSQLNARIFVTIADLLTAAFVVFVSCDVYGMLHIHIVELCTCSLTN